MLTNNIRQALDTEAQLLLEYLFNQKKDASTENKISENVKRAFDQFVQWVHRAPPAITSRENAPPTQAEFGFKGAVTLADWGLNKKGQERPTIVNPARLYLEQELYQICGFWRPSECKLAFTAEEQQVWEKHRISDQFDPAYSRIFPFWMASYPRPLYFGSLSDDPETVLQTTLQLQCIDAADEEDYLHFVEQHRAQRLQDDVFTRPLVEIKPLFPKYGQCLAYYEKTGQALNALLYLLVQ